MQEPDNKHQEQFNMSLPLPVDDAAKIPHPKPTPEKTAADLIRRRIAEAYDSAPSIKLEAQDVSKIQPSKLSSHQEFIYELTSSGKPTHEIQTAWHEYYAALPDSEKMEVWEEFYKSHPHVSKYAQDLKKPDYAKAKALHEQYTHPLTRSYARAVSKVKARTKPTAGKPKAASPWRSLIFGLSVGGVVILIFLFGFFNERFIAPFIQPSRNVTNTPIISSTVPISNDSEIIIPKINVQIPVVYNVTTINENAVELALEQGVVHYADTALPGQDGNAVIVGHSSNNIFNPGKYKFAFVLLSHLDSGDTFYLQKDGKRYTYQVYKKEIVKPTDTSVLGTTDKLATATLITCDPPGTSTNRLVVVGEQIDPNPALNIAATTTNTLATKSAIIPGNAPSLWSRIMKWLTY